MLVMTLAICGTVLFVAVTLLIGFQILNFRANFKRDTATIAAIIANNSTGALAFNDRTAAEEILLSLKGKANVQYAFLVNARDEVMASFGELPHAIARIEFPQPKEFRFHNGSLLYTDQVRLDGKIIGLLYLRSDYRSVFLQFLRFYGGVTGGVLCVGVLLAVHLSGRMRKFVADPVLNLADTARHIGEQNDYSVRSPLQGRGDELGALAKAFNHMLSRIQHQDADLNLSQQKLESLVNSIDGIVWEWSPVDSKFTFVSRQSERILGYPPESWLESTTLWDDIVHPGDAALATQYRAEATARRQPYSYEYRMKAANGGTVWIRESGVVLVENDRPTVFRGIFQDITEQKIAAEELDRLNRQLVDASRQAGMAEVATGVLHNVGNVLNSVNVSANLLRDKLARSKVQNLLKVTQLLRENAADTGNFISQDPRGRQLPGYLIKLGDHLFAEQLAYQKELENLGKNIEHIKEIVSMQQSYASLGGITEAFDPRELVEDALRINEGALARNNVKLVREFAATDLKVAVDKHKVLQVLVNLLRNAKHAIVDSGKTEGLLTVAIQATGHGRVQIHVRDNGIGIPRENLTRIFQHGFTTKKQGHGFGLHSGANAAKEMGGALFVHSDGPGEGAVFTLELPAASFDTRSIVRPAQPQPEPLAA